MRRLAKSLVAGALAASSLAGAAWAQEDTPPAEVVNDQVTVGDIFADQRLDVVMPEEGVQSHTDAAGNEFETASEGVQINVDSRQTAGGKMVADSEVKVWGPAEYAKGTTSARGNSGSATVYGSNLRGSVTQTISEGAVVSADNWFEQHDGPLQWADPKAVAVGNSQDNYVSDGWQETQTTQTVNGSVTAEMSVVVDHVADIAQMNATAIANDFTSQVVEGSGTVDLTQRATGPLTQAASFVSMGNGQTVTGKTFAAGNQMTADSNWGRMETNVNQTKEGYLRSQSVVSVYDFGHAQAEAAGVGNSATIGNQGNDTTINVAQLNSGGVEVIAETNVGRGYDAYATADAIGNSAIGYACSECPGPFTANNHQVNNGDISASATVNIDKSSRTVVARSSAVGNSATYYVSGKSGD